MSTRKPESAGVLRPKPTAPASKRNRRGLLIVEDDRLTRWSLREALRREYRIWFAESAEKALSLLPRLKHLDGVITDVRLPGMDGVDFLRRVRKDRPDLKIFLMTAFDLDHAPRKAFSVRADGYLSKPFDLSTVKDMLVSHLSGPRLP